MFITLKPKHLKPHYYEQQIFLCPIGSISIDMYIPKEIEITCPFVESENKMLPLCYYDQLNLKWNVRGHS